MKQLNIRLMYAIALLQGMVFYGPIATLYRQAQGVSVFRIALIESISLILCLVLEIPWGIVADKIGYRRTMIFCNVLYLISKIVFWQATGFAAFLVERMMLSIIIAGLSGVDTSILYLSCKEGQSQRIFGIYNSLQTAGLLCAAFVYSVFAGNNFKLAGLLTVFSYGLAALLSFGIKEVKSSGDRAFSLKDIIISLRSLFQNKRLIMMLIAVGLMTEAHQTITVFLNQPQYIRCGLSPSTMGYIYIAVTIAGMVSIFSARFTGRVGKARSMGLLCAVASCACLMLALTGDAALSILSILALRIGNSLFQPLQTELQNRQTTVSNRATALSINAMVVDCVGVGTNVIFGSLAQIAIQWAFVFGAGICALSGLMFALWFKANPHDNNASPSVE